MSELTIEAANLYGRPRPAFAERVAPYDHRPALVIHQASWISP